MWAEMVHRAGVGPAPCPISKLTTDVLIEKICELTSSTIKEAAAALAVKMDTEDGVMNALQHFWSALPRDSMMCSVGLIMGKSLLAKYQIKGGIPISAEVASVLVDTSDDHHDNGEYRLVGSILPHLVKSMMGLFTSLLTQRDWLRPHATATHALRNRGGYDTFLHGLVATILEFFELLWRCFFQFFHVPDKFARKHGLVGCIFGILVSPLYFWYASRKLIVNQIDRLGVTVANGILGKQWLYFIDRSAISQVYRDMSTLPETRSLVSDKSVRFIREAYQTAINARNMFDACKPQFMDGHWHYREVQIKELASRLIDNGCKLKLSEEEFTTLVERLNWETMRMDSLSYNRFCLFIGEAVHGRFYVADEATSTKDLFTEAVSCYLN